MLSSSTALSQERRVLRGAKELVRGAPKRGLYLRYDTDAEVVILNELYGHLRLYVNFFQPQMKLVDKTRTGAKVVKRYDPARTPYQRLFDVNMGATARKELRAQYLELNPVQLKETSRAVRTSF